ncbi:MAG: hypothetical protein Fur003_1290 [Candidatus Dojkabacteria bacterium]
MTKYKRSLRRAFTTKNKKLSLNKVLIVLVLVSTVLFITTQIITNAVLSPLGHKLAAYNTEKNLLLEENRELEQQIAKDTSITIIDKYSQENLKLKKTLSKNTVYVNGSEIQARN